MLWYFPIPIVPLSLHALLLFILSDGDCCLFFKSPTIVPRWMGGHDTLQMCVPVCVCLCVSMPVQFPLICSWIFNRVYQMKSAPGTCRFHLITTTATPRYMHAFVCAYMHGCVALPANQHSLSVDQKQDPTSLHLLTKAILWKSTESPISPL